ncbi:hypothetical protein PGB28_07410 [Primorskyibacter aestuariivivens]|uniref:hypothetical protein n=1 Tax=Primorskyibacter aestuariivivens TaxID=1888912 RepID=UPI0023012F1A|nr:hypothetical protein [Primorskyibacter aestuariivivens]MDA7428281.1 hypothetical protein [Primorskyibacter aestuariivivens]
MSEILASLGGSFGQIVIWYAPCGVTMVTCPMLGGIFDGRNDMKSKLNAIYMVLCATIIVAGLSVHASYAHGHDSLTSASENGVIALIEAATQVH